MVIFQFAMLNGQKVYQMSTDIPIVWSSTFPGCPSRSHGRPTRWLGSPYNGISGICTSIQRKEVPVCPCWGRWSSPKMGWYTKKILADWNILVTLKKIEHNLPLTISVGFEQSLFLLVIYFNSHTKRNPIGMEYQHISEPWVLGDWAFEPLNNKITIHRESHGFGASPLSETPRKQVPLNY